MQAALLPSRAAYPNLPGLPLANLPGQPLAQPLTAQALTTLIGAAALRCC